MNQNLEYQRKQKEKHSICQIKYAKKTGYYAKWRKNNPNYFKELLKRRPDEHKKFLVRLTLNYAVRTGKVKKFSCKICGNKKSEGHHENYGNPLDVIWLCKIHHEDYHKNLKQTK